MKHEVVRNDGGVDGAIQKRPEAGTSAQPFVDEADEVQYRAPKATQLPSQIAKDQQMSPRQSGQNQETPAQLLAGRELKNNWTVELRIDRPLGASGGAFSTSYIVRSGKGDKAFLKALDYSKALQSPEPARELRAMTAAYLFEKDLLEKCKTKGLSRIVRILDSGTIPSQTGYSGGVVEYMIFELAEQDVRSCVNWGRAFDATWTLRTVHQAAAALQQLHSAEIAHQDVKPSNVLVFRNQQSKLADLGRAHDRHSPSPHDELICPGDLAYAPPEYLYGHVPEDWPVRRLGCDLYLLGNLVTFLFSQVSMTHLLSKRVTKQHRWDRWQGVYSDVLPYLQHYFAQAIREIRELVRESQEYTQIDFADEVAECVNQLCNPDPRLRGHPRNIRYGGNQYSLERYVSAFDLLAKKAEWALMRGNSARKLS